MKMSDTVSRNTKLYLSLDLWFARFAIAAAPNGFVSFVERQPVSHFAIDRGKFIHHVILPCVVPLFKFRPASNQIERWCCCEIVETPFTILFIRGKHLQKKPAMTYRQTKAKLEAGRGENKKNEKKKSFHGLKFKSIAELFSREKNHKNY